MDGNSLCSLRIVSGFSSHILHEVMVSAPRRSVSQTGAPMLP